MDMLLELGQKHHPELRRWSLIDERSDGTRVLADKQTEETVVIPQYHFALFPGGNPAVVPYDMMSIIAPPNPSVIVPEINTIDQKSDFSRRVNNLLSDNIGAKLVVDGPNNEYVYLDYPLEYINLPRWYSFREKKYPGGERGRVRLSEGDTLFSYTFPREVDNKMRPTTGDLDYLPTSVVAEMTGLPAVDGLDLTTPAHLRDWTKIWPQDRKYPQYEPTVTLKDFAKLSGIEYYRAEYMYRRGMFDGSRVDGLTGKIMIPKRYIKEKS